MISYQISSSGKWWVSAALALLMVGCGSGDGDEAPVTVPANTPMFKVTLAVSGVEGAGASVTVNGTATVATPSGNQTVGRRFTVTPDTAAQTILEAPQGATWAAGIESQSVPGKYCTLVNSVAGASATSGVIASDVTLTLVCGTVAPPAPALLPANLSLTLPDGAVFLCAGDNFGPPTVTTSSDGAITWSVSDPMQFSVTSGGEVTTLSTDGGIVVVTATQAATSRYMAASATYELNFRSAVGCVG